MAFVIAIDAGTTGVRSRAVFADGRPGGRVPGVHPALPAAGLGRARRRGDLATPCGPRWTSVVGGARRPGRRDRHHQPARDGRGVGPRDRQAAAPGHRVAGPPHRRAVRRARRRRAPRRSCAERTGLVLDPYFSATKIEWLLTEGGVADRPRPRARHDRRWLLWNLTGGDRARHRPVERQPHDALRHPPAGVVRRAVRPVRRAPSAPCPRCARRAGASASPSTACGVPAGIPVSRHRRRPAGGPVRPGVLRARAWPRTPTAPAASCS